MLWDPQIIELQGDFGALGVTLATLPDSPAVFLIWPHHGSPYLGKTIRLRRRLLRLLCERSRHSRILNLRAVVSRVEYCLTGSWLETNLLVYEQARRLFPESYLSLLKFRKPPYLKIVSSNMFPRTQVTTRLAGARAVYYGPFRSRQAAEDFENRLLDLFQMRRCQEDLEPSPSHPGCIYGEMNMCLRPCQQVVSREEYQAEVKRVVAFLTSDGRSLLELVTRARDRLSEEMNFEEAARQHKLVERIEQTLKFRDGLVRDIDRLHGIAVTSSISPGAVELWFFVKGFWQSPIRFPVEAAGHSTVSLDHRLQEITAMFRPRELTQREREEHLALLARWRYSSWTDGEWLPFDRLEDIPYRKLVRAISRVASKAAMTTYQRTSE